MIVSDGAIRQAQAALQGMPTECRSRAYEDCIALAKSIKPTGVLYPEQITPIFVRHGMAPWEAGLVALVVMQQLERHIADWNLKTDARPRLRWNHTAEAWRQGSVL